MTYNKIHDQYRLGLGLYFQLKFGHNDHPDGWICFSNIPELNFMKIEADNLEEAIYEVMGTINSGRLQTESYNIKEILNLQRSKQLSNNHGLQ